MADRRPVWKGEKVGTIGAFIFGGVLCGTVAFLVASCIFAENTHDMQKVYETGYMEGFDDGIHMRDNKYGRI